MNIRYYEKRPGAWHLDFRLANGKRARPYGGATEAEARRSAPAVVAAALSDKPASTTIRESVTPQRGAQPTAGGATLDEAYRRALKVRERWLDSKNKGTLQNTFDAICATKGVSKNTPMAAFTRDFVRDLRLAWLQEPGKRKGTTLSKSTVNHRLSMVTVLLEVCDMQPHGVKHLSVKGIRRTRRVSDREIEAVAKWCVDHADRRGALQLRDAVYVGLDCLAREGELLGLTWRDHIPADAGHPATLTFHDTKNHESRTVPLTARSAAILEAQRKAGLPRPFGGLCKSQLTALWNDAKASMGLASDDEFVFHTLRHEGISRLAEKPSVSPLTVQAMAGHASIATTQIYYHASLGAMARAVQQEGAPA